MSFLRRPADAPARQPKRSDRVRPLGAVGRKTRRAGDMVSCCKVFAPVLSRAVGAPLPAEYPSLQR
jgi:hypothetical protein